MDRNKLVAHAIKLVRLEFEKIPEKYWKAARIEKAVMRVLKKLTNNQKGKKVK